MGPHTTSTVDRDLLLPSTGALSCLCKMSPPACISREVCVSSHRCAIGFGVISSWPCTGEDSLSLPKALVEGGRICFPNLQGFRYFVGTTYLKAKHKICPKKHRKRHNAERVLETPPFRRVPHNMYPPRCSKCLIGKPRAKSAGTCPRRGTLL